MSDNNLHIAVIGSGIAGMAAAWLLNQRHRITVYEQNDYIGGHSNTVDVPCAGHPTPVDTGFIVYNEQNYPNLTEVFPIDIFRHKSLGSDHKSVTFHFRFQHPDKTLEDKEVSSVINKIKRLVLSEFDAKLRSSN